MFRGWATSDEVALGAAVVSVLALIVSAISARYSAVQAGVARRKERAEIAAEEPVIVGDFMREIWPGWWWLRLTVTNRLDVPITCERVSALKPRKTQIAAQGDVAISNRQGEVTYPAQPPDSCSSRVEIEETFLAAGTTSRMFDTSYPRDRGHIELLVSLPEARPSSVRQSLTMSVSVRRTNESVPYAETIVVTKVPPVSTSTAT